jgi:hypothetical protein
MNGNAPFFRPFFGRKRWLKVGGDAPIYPPRRIGRIIASVLCRSALSLQCERISFLTEDEIIKASLQPVKTPLDIIIFQSFSGVPIASILFFILISMGDKITQLSEVLKLILQLYCCTKSLKLFHQLDKPCKRISVNLTNLGNFSL